MLCISSAMTSMVYSRVLSNLSYFAWTLLCLLRVAILNVSHTFFQPPKVSGLASGKNVLVTTGRMAKSLHIVRALKDIGARVIVSDYAPISASAVSLACDDFILLPPLNGDLDGWIQSFADVLKSYNIDMIVPSSTINEALYLGVAKQRLAESFPHIQWLCADAEMVIKLDDRTQFYDLCVEHGIPAPESGVCTSAADIPKSKKWEHGTVLKRVESSVNRKEEIVFIAPHENTPEWIVPSSADIWQWQQFVKGEEFSVWYICCDGEVTMSACCKSGADMLAFDQAKVPADLDLTLRKFIKKVNLSGQYAFDFIVDRGSDEALVLECNPRASSVLESVSKTPLWAEAFFRRNVEGRRISQDVGFLRHANSWPFAARSEGCFSWSDPLPFFAAEVVWPLNAIAECGLAEQSYQKIDVNICKIIKNGHSPPRNFSIFESDILTRQLRILLRTLNLVDTLIVDSTIPGFKEICKVAGESDCKLIPVYIEDETSPLSGRQSDGHAFATNAELSSFVSTTEAGNARVLVGAPLSHSLGHGKQMSLLVQDSEKRLEDLMRIPLTVVRVLHVIGSCTSEYYEGVSRYYGFQCISSVSDDTRYEHHVAYVHGSGEWSIFKGSHLEDYKTSPKLSFPDAIAAIASLRVELVIPHMFDYDGMTAYRSLFDIMRIPSIGCSAEALALSTNKAKTKACAAMAGVKVPESELLVKGQTPTMQVPMIVKPTEEDNSMGVTLVEEESAIEAALTIAFQYGDEVLCERFIPLGRELRVGVVERIDGSLEMLPVIEYHLSNESPIRKPEDKVSTNAAGLPTGLASGGRSCPADVGEELKSKLYKAVVTCHRALNCRHYSIYDFRIDPNGEVYLLETCLYCSFAPKSALVTMAEAGGKKHPQLFFEFAERVVAQSAQAEKCKVQKFGMKHRP